MVEINEVLKQCQLELTFDFIRAAGPGGQNVNKVATAVQLRFDINSSTALTQVVKERLIHLAGKRVTNEGVLVIEARHYRTQDQNKEDAIARFSALILKSFEKPKPRFNTKPSLASKEKRLQFKKKRGEIKRKRQNTSFD